MYTLDYGEKQPLNGYTNYYTFMQLELFCQWLGKWDKILMSWLLCFYTIRIWQRKGTT